MQEYLVVGFKSRMAYFRKPEGQKRGNSGKRPPKQVTPKPKMPDLPPIPFMPIGEDKASYDRHLKFLGEECTKLRPNKQVIHFSCLHKIGCISNIIITDSDMFQAWDELIPLIIRRAQGIKSTAVKLLLSDLEDSTSDGNNLCRLKFTIKLYTLHTHPPIHTLNFMQSIRA